MGVIGRGQYSAQNHAPTFLLLSIPGCDYAFTEETEIETQLLSVTPLGTSAAEVEALVSNEFGDKAYIGIGSSKQIGGEWEHTGWFIDPTKRKVDDSYVYTYKIGTHPSIVWIFPKYVYAQWFFDSEDQLVQVKVFKEMDGL